MSRIEPTRNNSLPSSSNTTPALRTLDSFAANNVSFALSGAAEGNSSDAWTQISIRCLPVFNGEGYKGYIEDLNELVRIHVQSTISRAQKLARSRSRQASSQADIYSLATGLLVGDLSEFILSGCLTLSAGLSNLGGHQLLSKLNEIWLFFWNGVLPALEGIFVFLRSDERLRASTGTNSDGILPEEGAIDIRRLALIGFRDHVIIPRIDHLAGLFQDLYTSGSSSESISRTNTPPPPPIQFQSSSLSPTRTRAFPVLPATTTNIPSPLSDSAFSVFNSSSSIPSLPSLPSPIPIPIPNTSASTFSTPIPSSPHSNLVNTQAENARRRQMISVLASSLTDDDRQAEMDSLLRMMRLGASNTSRDRPRAPNRSWTDGNREMEEDLAGTPFSQDSSQFTSSSVPA